MPETHRTPVPGEAKAVLPTGLEIGQLQEISS